MNWRATSWLIGAVVVAATGLALAVLLRRPDLLILSFAPAGIALWSLAARPSVTPELDPAGVSPTTAAGQQSVWSLHGRQLEGAEQWWAQCSPADGIRWEQDLLGGYLRASASRLDGRWTAERIGGASVGAALTELISPWAAYRVGPLRIPATEVRVRPQPSPVAGQLQLPHPVGLVGANRSSARGSGSEFADVRAYRPGDRLRAIHWPRTARTGELHVRDNYAEQDAAVLVVVDGSGGGPSWQRGLQGAATVAEFFIRHGDRVALVVLGAGRPAYLPYGAGLRNYHRIADVLSAAREPAPSEPPRRVRLPVGPGCTVLMLSSILTDVAPTITLALAQRGVPMIVLDTVPDAPDIEDPLSQLALRLRLLERRTVIERLTQAGAQVTPWVGAGSLELPMRRLARRPPVRVRS
ncbi:DUF58 domain-containing protein [Branchiibius sp. NY16-3462-2]|uniref:DUF58 domain-containing protein n=1 Tax=Branchiibius sp. NY16-3462-2 TaxID=1807500 RepID=UPI0025BF7549|nr:DUF58 domain-containing protein [Branchiibius sp. NY16-3462-2]